MSVFRRLTRLARGKALEWQKAAREVELEDLAPRTRQEPAPRPTPPPADDEHSNSDDGEPADDPVPPAPVVTPRKRRL